VIEAPLALAALVTIVAALSFWLDHRVRLLSQVGAGMIALLVGALLSNLGLVPAASPVYDAIGGAVTSLAIAWLLLAVDLSDLRKVGGRTLAAFGLALAGTTVGAVSGALLLAPGIGPDTWKLSGVFTATYTGGSVNFVSVARGVDLTGTMFAGATAADAVTTAIWLGVTLLVPVWFGRFFAPIPAAATQHDGDGPPAHPFFTGVSVSALDLAVLLATGFVLIVTANAIAARVPGVPAVVWLTTLALGAGHIGPLRRTKGSLQLGTLALLFFFVVIGISSRIADIIAVGINVFWFTVIVVAVHGLIVYGGGRLLKIDAATLSIASQAAVGGPSSALAVAVAREWPGFVLPSVAVGLLGYAVGTYLGFAVAGAIRALGIG